MRTCSLAPYLAVKSSGFCRSPRTCTRSGGETRGSVTLMPGDEVLPLQNDVLSLRRGRNIESVIMWRSVILLTSCSIVLAASERTKAPEPTPRQLVIGRDTFFDFGPPFHYFEVISIEPDGNQTHIARMLITPPGDPCTQPAQIELKAVTVPQPIPELLEGKNPCSISERDLRKENKRCKHCLTFSGADITMRVQCNGISRHLRMDILDRDMFDPAHANTPVQTSWTMRLLGKLDAALGPGPMDKRIIAASAPAPLPSPETSSLDELAARQFDDLFPRTTVVLSDIYRQALHPPPTPSVHVVSAEPTPSTSEVPQYPPIARFAHVSGRVQFTGKLGRDGHPADLQMQGHALLKKSVETAVSAWTYINAAPGTDISGVVDFRDNCTSQTTP